MPRDYIKSSHASVLPRTNASIASKSPFGDPFNIIFPCNTVPVDHIMYTIEELVGIGCQTHNTVRDAMKTWMSKHQKKLTPNCGPNPLIITEVGLGEIVFDQLCVTSRKIADIAIMHDNIIYVQFEVESDRNRDATIRKLTYGLVDQLRFLKNRGVSTNQISGFYIPVTSGYVEVIKCVWEDKLLKFDISSRPLQKEEVLPKIKDVYHTQLLYKPCGSRTDFKVPLTPSFVEETWGRNAFQWKSGESIVIFSPSDDSVYKHPLNPDESGRLHYLQQSRESLAALQHSSIPVNFIWKDMIPYFKYPMYSSHLSRDEARAIVTELVDEVAAALQELHQVNVAHQDIRLENVCFKHETGSVVLIDLDRSCSVDESASKRISRYGKTTMYNFPSSSSIPWTAENIDWRQFAIMIHYIVSDESVQDYHKLQLDGTHRFLSTMFNEG